MFNSATPRLLFQVRIAEWVAISSSRDLPKPRIEPSSPALAGGFFTLSHLGSPWTRLGVGKVKVAQLCPTLCDPMDCIVHGILQARILEWAAFPFSRGSSQPRDRTQVSCIALKEPRQILHQLSRKRLGTHGLMATSGTLDLFSPKANDQKAMAPHSSAFAWKIPWMEEPGRLQSMESQRVGHD